MAVLVLDASVVIAHLETTDALHARATAALQECEGDQLHLPASAYAECLVLPARRGLLETAREAITRVVASVMPVDDVVAEAAARIRARHRTLHLADALVLACGELLDADAVLTADVRWRRLPRVRVV